MKDKKDQKPAQTQQKATVFPEDQFPGVQGQKQRDCEELCSYCGNEGHHMGGSTY
jgi:hypothetical protein